MASIEEKGNLTSLANQKFKENKSTTLSSDNLLNKSSDNLSSLIETYTSLLEQFNNI
jgi:hypothetical protein